MKIKVRYGRVVLMEAVVEVENSDDISAIEAQLPGVYDGIPANAVGAHVEEVMDEENTWEVSSADADAELTIKKG